jgi:hypothetical protein
MENKVIFRDNQEVQAQDFNNEQDWMEAALDHVVLDAIEPAMSYAGFAMSKSAPTVCTVAAGRLYANGQVYAREEAVTIDLFNVLPITQKKQIAIVCWGTTIQQDIQPRDFIIDADTGQAQPQAVAMQQTRYCNVDIVPGVEAVSPQNPTIDATDLLIGYVLVDPTGIVSYQQMTNNMIDSVSDLNRRITSIESWAGTVEGKIAALSTALAALAAQLSNYVLITDFQTLVNLVNEIWRLIHLPQSYVWYGTDNFVDTSQSYVSGNVDGQYNAQISEGLRFPGTNASGGTSTVTQQMQLLNPQDPNALIAADGFTLPMPSGARFRMDCSFPDYPWIEERLLQYVALGFTIRHLYPSRHRHRCGPHFLPSPPALVWWYEATLDPTFHLLSFLNEVWEIREWAVIAQHMEDDCDWPQHKFERYKYFWHDCVDVPYWSKVFDNFTHQGQHICQTILNQQDGWLTGITVFMMTPVYMPLNLIIAGTTDQGQPDHTHQTVRRVVLDGDDVRACYDTPIQIGDIGVTPGGIRIWFPGVTTTTLPIPWGGPIQFFYPGWWAQVIPVYIFPLRINFPPVFLQAGKRYGLHFIGVDDHRFCISDRWECFNVHQGLYWINGANGLYLWPSATSPKSLRFVMHYAVWGQWQGNNQATGGAVQMELAMQPLQLPGGIGGVDILADSIIPAATDLSFQVQINGQWQPFTEDPNTPDLSSNPPLLPFKLVFSGTTDLMPAVSCVKSQVQLIGAPQNAFHHISLPITVGSNVSHIKVIAKLINFDSSRQTCSCAIHVDTTKYNFDTVSDDPATDGSINRTWVFNQSLVSGKSFYVETDGTNSGVGDRFIVSQEIRYAST